MFTANKSVVTFFKYVDKYLIIYLSYYFLYHIVFCLSPCAAELIVSILINFKLELLKQFPSSIYVNINIDISKIIL